MSVSSSNPASSALTLPPPVVILDDENRKIARLLTFVERDCHVSQRRLAKELGVALGLVNTYVRRCARKGLIKVKEAPPRRYAYYLTTKGFAEKARLTGEYLSSSFSLFRRARSECTELFLEARRRRWKSMALCGGGDFADIAILTAAEQAITICAIVRTGPLNSKTMGIAVFERLEDVAPEPDGWIITDLENSQRTYDELVGQFGISRVLAPPLLSLRNARSDKARAVGV